MKQIRGAPLFVCILLLVGGCGNRGSDLADQINLNMVKEINSGRVKTQEELEKAMDPVTDHSMQEIGIDPETIITIAEKDALQSAIVKYRRGWDDLIRTKWGENPE